MFQNSVKKGMSLALVTFALVGASFAESSYDNNTGCNPCPCPCPCPSENHDEGFFLGASYLYWTAYSADLDYAVDNLAGFDVSLGETKSKIHFGEYDWDSGYRLLGGYRWCDGSDLSIVWTHWSNTNTKKASLGGPGDTPLHLKPTIWSPAFANDRCSNARSKVELDYDVLDVLFGQRYAISCNLHARPHFGFRGVWIEQKEKVEYSGGRDFQEGSNDLGFVSWKSCYDGYGLHAGIIWDYDWCEGFGLYAQFGGSLVAGETDDCENQSGPEGTGSGVNRIDNNINVKEKQCVGIPGVNVGLGLAWEHDWSCGNTILSVGYEFNHWGFTSQIRRFNGFNNEAANAGAARGNILLHGLTITLAGGF